ESEYRVVSRENFERGLPLGTMRCDSRRMLADRIHTIRRTQTFAPRALRRFVSGIRPQRESDSGLEVRASFLVAESLGDEPTRVVWGEGHSLHALGGEAASAGFVGTKTWAHTAGGATPLLILWDSGSGRLKAVIEAFVLGQLRTGAVSGVATRWLARSDAA